MELQFLPSPDQVVSVTKTEFIPYDDVSHLTGNYSEILTPTTPSSKTMTTANNTFMIPPPFAPFSYSQSPTDGYCQVSPIEYSPSDKPSFMNNYCSVNDTNYYHGYGDYTHIADTPDSVFGDDANKDTNYDDNYFKFDADIIDKLTSVNNDNLNLDIDYVNYDEDNCNSKHQSPCSSPMDPWILSNGIADNVGSHSPKIENTQFIQMQSLPSINQAFSTHFTTIDCVNTNIPIESIGSSTNLTYDHNILDVFDSTFFDEFPTNDKHHQQSNGFINPENYNNITFDDKPNREFKDIWSDEKPTNTQQIVKASVKERKMCAKPKKIQHDLEDDETEQQLTCNWQNCYQDFTSQSALVTHIEKFHVCSTKGDEYTCHWSECPRQYRSFNARYKLLIHMRVHSGEKPNKCPHAGCTKAFSRLENLKIHQRSHTGERPYKCTIDNCPKSFSNSSDRAKHQRTHFDTRPYACIRPGCTKRYTDPSSLRKHVKNHDLKGRRKSHKETSAGRKQSIESKKSRRRFSESSILSSTSYELPTPSTPITPSNQSTKFVFDDVFDDPEQNRQQPLNDNSVTKSSNNAMNFDEMSNCLIKLMDHSTINSDNAVSSQESIGNGYKHDNNYDSINYVDHHNELGFIYFS